MSELKCPFCGEKIEHIEDGWCNCKNLCTGSGSIELWLQFIRTRKALDVAVDALDAGRTLARIAGFEMLATGMDEAVNKITALGQKDK